MGYKTVTLDFTDVAIYVNTLPPTTWWDVVYTVSLVIFAFCFAVWLLFYAK